MSTTRSFPDGNECKAGLCVKSLNAYRIRGAIDSLNTRINTKVPNKTFDKIIKHGSPFSAAEQMVYLPASGNWGFCGRRGIT